MPDNSESARKRSRSPSESEPSSNKRANTGQNNNHSSNASSKHPSGRQSEDVKMLDKASDKDQEKSPSKDNSTSDGAPGPPAPPVAQIHMRCLIVTQDASIIIGKAGSHVNEIREKSGAKVMVSESIPGNPERILNVSGALDAVSKAFGLIVRRINDEPFDVPSVPGSRAVTIKFIIPNSRMGSVIGKGGSKIKEIQEASGARLNASEGMLPGSTERVLSISGVADAIHIATYYVGNILIEAGPLNMSSSNSSYRPSSNSRSSGGGGGGGPRSSYQGYGGGPPGAVPHGGPMGAYPAAGGGGMYNPPSMDPAAPMQTQQIYIPNDLVGCIIGKGGSKINEIRSVSGSQIRIMEPGATVPGATGGGPNERLVTVTGQPQQIQTAVQLLYHRLEQEKQKQMMSVNGGAPAM